MPPVNDPNLLVGTRTHDDAGVYRLRDDLVLVQTVDFFPPVIDDAFIYGQIAAANALSDVYAMNGEPKTAMNLVGYPDDTDPGLTWLGDILGGGAERCALAGAAIVGGHTVRDREIKFGLSVTGIAHPEEILTNATAREGDRLILTKPLGTGFVTTAHRTRRCPDGLLAEACASMVELNKSGRDALRASGGAHALTDITGFGLCGHLLEMAEGSGKQAVIHLDSLPLLRGVEPFIQKRYFTRASKTNREYVTPTFSWYPTPTLNDWRYFLMLKPPGACSLVSQPTGQASLLRNLSPEKHLRLLKLARSANGRLDNRT